MARLILVLAVVAGLWWLLKVRSRPRAGGNAAPPATPSSPSAEPRPDTMVACAHCGVHLPRREALPSLGEGAGGKGHGEPAAAEQGDHFCSEAHRQAGRAAVPPP